MLMYNTCRIQYTYTGMHSNGQFQAIYMHATKKPEGHCYDNQAGQELYILGEGEVTVKKSGGDLQYMVVY